MSGTARKAARYLAVYLAAALTLAGSARAAQIHSPHSAAACLECHRDAAQRGEAGPEVPSILVPEGNDPHRVLGNACGTCHPGQVPPFWLVVFPKDKVLEKEPERPAASTTAPTPAPVRNLPMSGGRPTFPNPHDTQTCADCHANKVSFDKPTVGDKTLLNFKGDMSEFCVGCHDDSMKEHFPLGNVPKGQTTCLTCHQAHRPAPYKPALRIEYMTFIREAKDFNPHAGWAYCRSCHPNKPVKGEPPDFLFGPTELGRLCIRCHEDVDHHPINKSSGKKTWKMDFLNWPLQEGKITCVTCHDNHVGGKGAASRYFLRGEPYKRVIDFCQNCHEPGTFGKINAHAQLTASGEIISKSCIFCHADILDPRKAVQLSPKDFNDSLTGICTQCHENFPHPDDDHMVQPSQEKYEMMRSYATKRDVNLPLDYDGRITCVTCHNPHAKGLLTGPDAVGADERKRLRLATFNEICAPCHGRH